jgi:NADPH-dependent 2,4-dienoyl-CoA reductase/sulfur reductase-like enzyme
MKTTRIVIAGGGFAGLYAAIHFDKRLARRADVEVTLISRDNFILFTPMLHEVAAGDLYPGDIVNPLRRILRHVKVVTADVQTIDLNTRRVHCMGGIADRELEFEDLPASGVPYVKRELNWVRVAQRFPVRIEVENPDPNLFRMGASAVAIIDGPPRR